MNETVCPCEVFVHPRIISNPSGRTSIDYRVGDYTAFRHALLRSRSGETALTDWHPTAGGDLALADWHPTAGGDLALQLLEWWAYLADVLTFYNERAIHEGLLRTAVLPEDVRRIVRLLGYRPRPGIGATGVVAALTDSPRPFVLAQGFPIQGASGPGKPPQVFELDEDVEIGLLGRPLPPSARLPPLPGRGDIAGTRSTVSTVSLWKGYAARNAEGRIPNDVPAHEQDTDTSLLIKAGKECTVAVRGVVTLVKPDDTIVVLKRDWNGEKDGYALVVVNRLQPSWDDLGRPITLLTLHPGQSLPSGSRREDYRILKATKLAHLWLYHERYPASAAVDPLRAIGNVIGDAVDFLSDPIGAIFGGGPPPLPPEDSRVLSGVPGFAHLDAITRGIRAGDPVLFEQSGKGTLSVETLFKLLAGKATSLEPTPPPPPQLVQVAGYSEQIWYANAPEMDRIGRGPPVGPPGSHKEGGLGGLIGGSSSAEAPIPIPHSKITFDSSAEIGKMAVDLKTIVVHYGWQDVGEVVVARIDKLVDEPLVKPDGPADAPTADPTPIEVPAPPGVPPNTPLPVIVEDVTGAGVPGWLGVTNPEGPPLVSPLRALLNLLPVSRGESVAGEILGSGNSILINQEFVLGRSPLTYLTDAGPRSMNGYRSTLRVRVDGIEWREVATFYGQPSDARVFVTREDDEQRTHVRFGDGEFGVRLPAGNDNVVARYRYGSGAEVPRIGSLTTILRPQEGLQAIRNPIAPGGGADPDPPDQIRRYAPRSVLTFGRAVSGDDYETVAAQTPGVRRAAVRWAWDANSQRTLVKVFVGDDDAAVVAARTALRAFADPNRPVVVELAAPRYADLSFTLEIDPDYLPDAVGAAVRASLLDPQQEPFGTDVVRIDEVVYDSQIYDLCMRVPGVVAVHGLAFRISVTASGRRRHPLAPPGFGRVFELWDAALPAETLRLETGERHSPGEGRFYLLRGDCLHINTQIGRHGQ